MAITNLYSDKQLEVLRYALKNDFFMLINHGAKRSGKTVVDNDIFIMELKRVRKIADKEMVKEPQYILAGATLSSLERNVLIELKNKYDLNIKLNKFNQFKIFGVLVCCFGHSLTNDLDKIRGMTSYGAYINETTLAVEEVFNEIKSRCSGDGARIIMDTNSDSPEHYLKREYIDKEDGKAIKCFHWELEDNKFLTKRYIDNIKQTTPSGMFYDRDIKGLWVTAEGVVYADFNREKHYIQTTKGINFKKYVAGVDWGYSHYGVIVVIGIDDKDNYYLIEEHAKQFEEIDYWVKKAKEVKERYGNIPFYCDTARPEYIERFKRENIKAIDGNKAVLSGIESVAKLYKTDRLYILEPIAKRFKEEIYMYVWAEKKDEPIKVYDDVQDAMRYAIYTSQQENSMRMSNKPFINIPTR